jgi:putative colanic acid biosynthesis UDP-glucose lipid carrier transferase
MLLGLSFILAVKFDEPYRVLAALAGLICFVVYRDFDFGSKVMSGRASVILQRSIFAWAIVVGSLSVVGFALQLGTEFSRRLLLTWAVLSPVMIAGVQYFVQVLLIRRFLPRQRAVVAGISDVGRRLGQKIARNQSHSIELEGWFEDRSADRIGPVEGGQTLGTLNDLPEYVRRNKIDLIYIAIPIRYEKRMRGLLDDLQDTTASIYFVPDIFVFDLIQSRVDSISGIPVLALCETPFVGVNGLVKRVSDLALASVLFVLTLPLMLLIAFCIRLTTPGSTIFKQRRYGLDGEEIVVYKFRTMTTSDDDKDVRQASLNDSRITPIGGFLRRYSLDELPQIINVLQGRMSLVGPRPHAVAHNEEYRKLIKGYMIRHKVVPGITGLAQVRGFRGEIKSIDQMRSRIESDLEYLRAWSLLLDFKILAMTVRRVLNDSNAY